MNLIKQLVQELVTVASNPKVATTVMAATTTSGVSTAFDWIPHDIGKLASLVGIILSLVVITVHVYMVQKARLELQILRDKHRKMTIGSITEDDHDKSSS